MSQQSTGLSKHEKKRPRPRGRPLGSATRSEPPVQQPLLYSRKTAAALLSISQATLIAMEQAGTLRPIKLNHSKNGKSFYRAADIHTLAEKGVTRAEGDRR
jgi:hypothetical protein